MHYPEFDVLCHEVAGKLAELRRLTMETVILTDDQEALLAELTRLLRLVDATSSQLLHSLLGDTSVSDSDFLAELREELPLLAICPPSGFPPSPSPSLPITGKGGEKGVGLPSPIIGRGWHSEERTEPGEGNQPGEGNRGGEGKPQERPVPPGLLEEIYWEIRPVYEGNTRLLFAHDADWKFCLLVTDETGQTALLFDTDEDRAAYLETLTEGQG